MKTICCTLIFLGLLINSQLSAENHNAGLLIFKVDTVVNIEETVVVCSGQDYTFPDGFTEFNITQQTIHTSIIENPGSNCDSIIETTVNVVTEQMTEVAVIVCPGDSYLYPDGITQNNIFDTIIHFSFLQTADGICDSIVVTTISVAPSYVTADSVVICSGSSYTFPDGITITNITAQTIDTTAYQTATYSCDSLFIITVNVVPQDNTHFEMASVCSGDSYTFPDGTMQNNITIPLIYTSVFPIIGNICDSIIVTTLNVNPTYDLEETVSICFGDSYTFPDGTTQNDITTQTIYTSSLQTVGKACDSLVTTTIDIVTVNTNIAQTGNTLITDLSNGGYQWLNCDDNFAVISGETNQSFMPAGNGNYAVAITDNFCVDTSACFSFLMSGISNNEFSKLIRVSPNPTSGIVNIDLGKRFKRINTKVRTVSGQLVSINNFTESQILHLEIEGKIGLYLIEIETEEEAPLLVRVVKE